MTFDETVLNLTSGIRNYFSETDVAQATRMSCKSKQKSSHCSVQSQVRSLDRQITPQDLDCLREAWALFDVDRTEEITTEELGKVEESARIVRDHHFVQVLRKHGFRPSERELESMLKSVDKNSHDSGGIDFDEFIELLVNHGRNIDEDIAKSFSVFDIDGDGLITEDELQTTMNSLGEPMNEKEVKAMIAEADLDGDGKINFKEFQILMDNKEL